MFFSFRYFFLVCLFFYFFINYCIQFQLFFSLYVLSLFMDFVSWYFSVRIALPIIRPGIFFVTPLRCLFSFQLLAFTLNYRSGDAWNMFIDTNSIFFFFFGGRYLYLNNFVNTGEFFKQLCRYLVIVFKQLCTYLLIVIFISDFYLKYLKKF